MAQVTLRRTIQQIGHCVAEALRVVELDEGVDCALDDLEQASQLIERTVAELRRAKGSG
jgi:hypothetical protein